MLRTILISAHAIFLQISHVSYIETVHNKTFWRILVYIIKWSKAPIDRSLFFIDTVYCWFVLSKTLSSVLPFYRCCWNITARCQITMTPSFNDVTNSKLQTALESHYYDCYQLIVTRYLHYNDALFFLLNDVIIILHRKKDWITSRFVQLKLLFCDHMKDNESDFCPIHYTDRQNLSTFVTNRTEPYSGMDSALIFLMN